MRIKSYGLVVVCIAAIFCSNVSSSNDDEQFSKHILELTLPAGKPAVVSIAGAYSDYDVTTLKNDKLLSIQNGPGKHWSSEFVTLAPSPEKTNFKVVLSTHHPLVPLYKPEITILPDEELDNIDTYRALSKASVAWHEQTPESRQIAIALLQQSLNNDKAPVKLAIEITLQLIRMHLYLEQYDEALALHQSLSPQFNSQNTLSAEYTEYLKLQSELRYRFARFDEAITATCKYLHQLNNHAYGAQAELESNHYRVKLAKLIIEGSRNSKALVNKQQSSFLQNYFNSCSDYIKTIWHTDVPNIEHYLREGRNPIGDAKEYLDLSLLKVEKSNDPRLKAKVLEVLWFYYNFLDQHKEAELTIRLAIDSYKTTGNDETIALYYSLLGTSLMRLGHYAEGQRNYLESVELFKKYLPTFKLGEGYFALGFAYKKVGDIESSYRRFEQSLKVTMTGETTASPDLNICIFDFLDTEFPISLPSNRKLITLIAPTLVQLGIINRIKGNISLALEQHKCALSILQGTNEYYEVVALLELSQDYLDSEMYSEANLYAEKVIIDNRALTPQVLDARIIQLSAAISLLDHQKAEELVSSISDEFGDPDYFDIDNKEQYLTEYPSRQIRTLSQLIRANSILDKVSKKDRVQYIEHFAQRALYIIRHIKNQLAGSEAWVAAQNAFIHEYINALLFLNEDGVNSGHQKIFEVLDQYYSINYIDEQKNHSNAFTDEALTTESQKRWDAKLRAERNLVFASEDQKEQALKTLDLANDAFYSQNITTTRELGETNNTNSSLSEIQELMPPGDIFVRYYLDDFHSFRIEVTKDNWKLTKLPVRNTVRTWVESLETEIANNTVSKTTANPVIRQLLPLEAMESGNYNRFVFVPDDVLHKIPFSALKIKTTAKGYQSVRGNFEVVRTHSASHFYEKQRNGNKLENSVDIAIFADPVFNLDQIVNKDSDVSVARHFRNWGSSLARLHYTAQEAGNISKTYGSNYKIETALGLDATSSWLMSDSTRKAKLLHIATHGHYDPEYPQYVGIATSIEKINKENGPGFLSLTELLNQPFSSNLIVISGCETMLGKLYNGVGTKSLTHGLISRGAGSVIGTLWKIADRPTALFMKYFYEALKENEGNSSTALYAAKNKLASIGRYRDPIYWAGFVLSSSNNNYVENVFN